MLSVLASCSSVRKTYDSNKIKTDSTTQTVRDTASKTNQTDIDISNARVEIDFDSAVNAVQSDTYTTKQTPVVEAIKSIIKTARKAGAKKIIISADKFSDSSKIVQTSAKEIKNTQLKKEQTVVSKTVKRNGLSIWVYIGGGLFILIGAVVLYIKYTPTRAIVSKVKKLIT